MLLSDRNSARVTVNMTLAKRAELERIAGKCSLNPSLVIRCFLGRTAEEVDPTIDTLHK